MWGRDKRPVKGMTGCFREDTLSVHDIHKDLGAKVSEKWGFPLQKAGHKLTELPG
jgi:hypothetical protein